MGDKRALEEDKYVLLELEVVIAVFDDDDDDDDNVVLCDDCRSD